MRIVWHVRHYGFICIKAGYEGTSEVQMMVISGALLK